MSIVYNIYANDGHGGYIDYSTPIASTPGLTFVTPPLALSSDNLFAVRAFDSALGIEEANTDARVRVIIDANGQDITAQPNPPHAIFVRALAGGTCRATWAYNTAGQAGESTGFFVYLTQGTVPNYSSPVATVPYMDRTLSYECKLSGLSDDVTYIVAVRAYNAVAIEQNTSVVTTVVGKWLPPMNVDSLSAVPTYNV
jgi:hypothetical protein